MSGAIVPPGLRKVSTTTRLSGDGTSGNPIDTASKLLQVDLSLPPYSVVANDSTKNTLNVAAINQAIVDYSGTRADLILPNGDVYVDRAAGSPGKCIFFNAATDLTLRGQGAYATRILQKNTGDSGSSHTIKVSGASRIEFCNFTILQDTIDNADPGQQNHLITIMDGSTDIVGHDLIFGKAVGDQLRLIGGTGGPGSGVVKNIRFVNFTMHGAGVVTAGRTGARSGIALQSGYSNVEIGSFFIDGVQNSAIDGEPTGTAICELLDIHDGYIDNSFSNTSAAVSLVGNTSANLNHARFHNVTVNAGKIGIRYTYDLTISNLRSICGVAIPGTPADPNILVRDTNDSLTFANCHVERTAGTASNLLDAAQATNVVVLGGTWLQGTQADPWTMEWISSLRVTGNPKIKYTGSTPSARVGLFFNATNGNADNVQIDALEVHSTGGNMKAAVELSCRTPRTMANIRAANVNGRNTVTSCVYMSTNTTAMDQTPYITGADGYVTSAWKQVDAGDNPITTIFPIVSGNPGEICTHAGEATPEGAVTAIQGALCVWKNGDSSQTYRKSTGTGSTGWVLVTGVAATGTITCVAKSSLAEGDYCTVGDGIQPPIKYEFDLAPDGIVDGTATGSIVCVSKANLVDGETVTIGDGINPTLVYEFDVAGDGVTAGRIQVNVSTDTSATDVANRLQTAVNTNQPSLTTSNASGTLSLRSKVPGAQANITITETVANAGFTVSGLSGGADPGVPGNRRVQVNVSSDTTATNVADRLLTAITTYQPSLTVSNATGVLTVTSKIAGTFANVTITENVANAGFTVTGLTGGVNPPK